MNVNQNARNLATTRAVLLVVGCGPLVLVHGALSLLMVLPLVSLVGGDLRQAIFLLWWLVGTYGLAVLVYSSATFTYSPRRLPVGQTLGLLGGVLVSIPLILGFAGEWWTCVSALLAACAAGYILVAAACRRTPEVGQDHNAKPT
jgi:hypothetical protein